MKRNRKEKMSKLYKEGFTYAEIGKLYGVAPQTVWKILNPKGNKNAKKTEKNS